MTFGLQQRDLPFQVRPAGRHFGRFRRAVAGRPALHGIGDVDVVAAREIEGRQHVVEQLAGLADEGFALASSSAPGPSPTNSQSGSRSPTPSTACLRCSHKRTGLAGGDAGSQIPANSRRRPQPTPALAAQRRRLRQCGGERRERAAFPSAGASAGALAQAPDRRDAHLGQHLFAAQAHRNSLSKTSASSRPAPPDNSPCAHRSAKSEVAIEVDRLPVRRADFEQQARRARRAHRP